MQPVTAPWKLSLALAFVLTREAMAADPAVAFHWNVPTVGSGSVTLTMSTGSGSYSKTIHYGYAATGPGLASAFGARISADPSAPVWAKGYSDGTVAMKVRVAGAHLTSLQATIQPDGGSTIPLGMSIDTNVGSVASGGGPGPQISGLSMSHGKLGQNVSINGVNFGTSSTNAPQTSVTLNGSPVRFSLLSATAISVTIRNGDTSGNFVVSVGSAASNGVYFTVDAPDPCVVYPSFPNN